MVKELNNMKNKKSNSYKPYDTSNSFVKRVTSRVSQLLPQPTSWLSRFLSREPEQAGPVESQEGEDEETVVPPPSKRMRTVQTCTDFPMYHNNVSPTDSRRLEDKREEDLSPIRSEKFSSVSGPSRSQDVSAPGPSGLCRHRRFVSSTPAAPVELQAHQALPKVNGDDGSDSDSGSHVSSLPPETQPSRSLFRTLDLNKLKTSHRNAPDELNSSLLRSKQLKLDLSSSSLSSSRGRVSFDTTVFNSPFKGRLCGGLSVTRDESTESPFYRSNTTFGGASSCNDSLLRTRSLHSEVPIVIQPSQPQRVSDNLGSSTKKILKALEQFSTPLLEQSRRMQPRDRGLKRKVEVPYKELVIPQMPDLLRIKRRDARHARQSTGTLSLSRTTVSETTSDLTVPSKSHVVETVASESSSSHLSQRLGKTEESSKDRVVTKTDKKVEDNRKIKETPTLMTGLPLVSLPKFDTGLVKQQTTSTSVGRSSGSSVLKSPPIVFTFSKPITVADNATPHSSIPPSKMFSQPLDPNTNMSDAKPLVNCVNIPYSEGVEVMTYCPPTNIKLKKKEPALKNEPAVSSTELKSGSVLDVLNKSVVSTASELKSGSVMDFLRKTQEAKKKPSGGTKWECQGCYVSNDDSRLKCAACEQPRKPVQSKDSSKGFGNKFKINSNEWECKGCFIRNNVKDTKCVACEQANPEVKVTKLEGLPKSNLLPSSGFGDKFKPPAGSWECSSCLVSNKSDDLKCVSCSSDKPGVLSQPSTVKPAAPSLSNLFKKPEGSWECDTCLVRNETSATSCVSCGTNKPGAKADKPAPTFSFGIPPTTSTPNFSFGVSSTSTLDSSVISTSVFTSLVPSSQTAKPTFTFGIPSSPPENKTTQNIAPNAIFTSSANTNNIEIKTMSAETPKTEASKPPEKVSKVEPTFTFGIPNKDDGVASAVSNVKSIFGNVTTSSVSSPTSSSGVTPTTSSTSSTLPIFVNQISSTKSPVVSLEKTSVPATNPMFTFGSTSSLMSSFNKPGASETAKPPETSIPLFGNESEVKPMVTSPVTKVSVSNSVVDTEKNVPESKTPLFTSFLNSETPNPVFSSPSVNSFNTPSTVTVVKPVFTFTSGFPSGTDNNQMKANNTANSFGSQPLQPASSEGFTFNPSEPYFSFNQKKVEPSATAPFQFSSTTTNHTSNFNNATSANNQFNSTFGSTTSSPFSTQGSIFGSSAPQPAQTASFLFGASQNNYRPPPATTFKFGAQSGGSSLNNVGNTSVAGGFAFGQTQNSTPVQPPAFDPNVKPVFKFSGGQKPIFTATATPGAGTEERKIRKAFRRTTQK